MFPLETVLFPGGIMRLHVFEPRYRSMMRDCLEGDGTFGVVLISGGREVGGGDRRVSIGTDAHIEHVSRFDDGRWAVVARGTRRIVVESWLPDDPYPLATVRTLGVPAAGAPQDAVDQVASAVRRARALLSELNQGPAREDPPEPAAVEDDPEAAVWRLCAAAPIGQMDRQRLLEIGDPAERVSVLTELSLQVAQDLHRLLGGS